MLKRILTILGYTALFFTSLVIFFYFTFPYNLLATRIAEDIYKQTDYVVEMKNLEPSFGTHVVIKKVTIYNKRSPENKIVLDRIEGGISLLSLLIGRINGDIKLTRSKGHLEFEVSGALKPFDKTPYVLDEVNFNAKSFDFTPISRFASSMLIESVVKDPSYGALLGPMIEKMELSGALNGKIHFEPDLDAPHKSKGSVALNFSKLVLDPGNDTFGIPRQEFKKATIMMDIVKGTVNVNPKSSFESNQISIKPTGKVLLRKILMASVLDVDVAIALSGALKNTFQPLLVSIMGYKLNADDSIGIAISGSFNRPIVK